MGPPFSRRLILGGLAVGGLTTMTGRVWSQAGGPRLAVIAADADPGHFNPAISTGSHVHAIADSMFNGLVGVDQKSSPMPDLATRWDVSPDGKTYTFKLAEAAWHDGKPFSSADVKYTFENILFKFHARTKAGLGTVVDGIDALGPRTIVFRLKSPHPALLRRLDVTEAPILPKHLYENVGDPNAAPANLAPIGTGPFRFSRYEKDAKVVLERNSNYFKAGLPKLDRLVFLILKDPATQLVAYQQGELDYLPSLSGKDVAPLKAKGGTTIVTSTSGSGGGNCIMTVSFNLEREALRVPDLRKAFAMAINRQRIVEQVLFGQGTVAAAPISSGIAWAHADDALAAYAYDPRKAEELLTAANLPRAANGIRLRLDMVHFPTFNKYAELMKQDLARVGIDLVSRPLDREATVDTIFRRRDFDTNLISYCNGVDPEIGVRRMYDSANIGPVPFSNSSAYRNDTIDRLFRTAGSVESESERGALYTEAQSILARDLPYWWLVETDDVTAYKDSFTGFRPWTGQFAEEAQHIQS